MLVDVNKITNPNQLTNFFIQLIGLRYICRYGEKPHAFLGLFKRHTNQRYADQLRAYNSDSMLETKWLFLADIYGKLPNNNGELAKTLKNIFERAFAEEISKYYNPCYPQLKTPAGISIHYKEVIRGYFIQTKLHAIEKNLNSKRHYSQP